MAVDYYHFLVVSGPRPAVTDFVHRIAPVVDRRVAGKVDRQEVPFSFESMYAIAKIKGDHPGEAFDMMRWPIVRRGRGAEVRYRFHTRSVELHPLLKRLSKVTPHLAYALVTLCLDDGDFGHYAIKKGSVRGKWLGEEWRMPFYERVAGRKKVTLEDVYDDADLTAEAESEMRDAAMQIATGSDRRYRWTGGQIYRDLWDERANMMEEFARAIAKVDKEDD